MAKKISDNERSQFIIGVFAAAIIVGIVLAVAWRQKSSADVSTPPSLPNYGLSCDVSNQPATPCSSDAQVQKRLNQ